MPHQCTGCGHTFEDGSKEMLSGCPDCGGNKFQFRPARGPSDAAPDPSGSPTGRATTSGEPPERSGPDGSSVAETVGRATTKVRDLVASDPVPSDSEAEADADAEWPDDWESGVDTDDTTPDDPSASPSPSSTPTASGGDGSTDSDDIIDADARRLDSDWETEPGENAAQASARTDVVSPDELDENATVTDPTGTDRPSSEAPGTASDSPGTVSDSPETTPDGEVVSEPTDEDPDLAELREQLNDQFESIKILEPGQYELNLMELYDREEYIIALQENGRYVIQVPEQWIGEDLEDR